MVDDIWVFTSVKLGDLALKNRNIYEIIRICTAGVNECEE